MTATAAGVFRRTALERADQRVAWERSDQAFFAAGACHILAWTCRESYPEEPIGIAAVRFPGERQVFHAFATWNGWAFDHSGWNREGDLLAANADFEGGPLEVVEIDADLAEFCDEHYSRMPHQYWRDPRPRARAYLGLHSPPWAGAPAP
ncbi:hypothetical protein KM427_02500 [Nocardioides sp. LMS-CY]|uniref:Uncharacterized protein n=1 Tax=Nocardioides soli TaxID=1036020 RepID=A0A7W4VVF9_9ACTN|nr:MULTISPECIES: hypothetical protein [Nocardioides]MBB3042503.1 hypothetical protein [Nocardioides soli]QWF22634.1 hypothetical protein KM427_02500 [Nocardioides sp. LMS-CY]